MKKINPVLITILFLNFCSIQKIIAQNINESTRPSFSLLGSMSLPIGEFASTNSIEAGFANLGFGIGLDALIPFTKNLGWISNISFIYHSVDKSSMGSMLGGIGLKVTDAGNYFTYWFLTGLDIEAEISPHTNIYMLAQAGLLLSSFPDIVVSYSGSTIKQTTTLGKVFSYCVGMGVKLKNINIGIRLYDGKPEYEQTATYGNNKAIVKVKLPVTVFQIMAGFIL